MVPRSRRNKDLLEQGLGCTQSETIIIMLI